MRVCILSHSNCALRQQKCWVALSKYASVLVVSPKEWGNHRVESFKEGDFELFADKVVNAGDMRKFRFSEDALETIRAFNPDIIYNQDEVWCAQSVISQDWAKQVGCKFVQFCWENIQQPSKEEQVFLSKCDLVIAGNNEAKELHKASIVMPQVGIDLSHFKPLKDVEKDINVVFVGRPVPEKGVEYIKQAYPETKFITGVPYEQVPQMLNRAKVFVNYPYDTPQWREQFGPYAVLEAMACGVPVITSNTKAVQEWLIKSGAILLPQHSPDLLKLYIEMLLEKAYIREERINQGLEFVKKFDNDVIVKRLIERFEEIK